MVGHRRTTPLRTLREMVVDELRAVPLSTRAIEASLQAAADRAGDQVAPAAECSSALLMHGRFVPVAMSGGQAILTVAVRCAVAVGPCRCGSRDRRGHRGSCS